MSNETKNITANEMAQHLKELLGKNTVGISTKEEEGAFEFRLPGGKTFRIAVAET